MATTYKIHPAIGIARVGNSPDEFFVGTGASRGDSGAAGRLQGRPVPGQAAGRPLPDLRPPRRRQRRGDHRRRGRDRVDRAPGQRQGGPPGPRQQRTGGRPHHRPRPADPDRAGPAAALRHRHDPLRRRAAGDRAARRDPHRRRQPPAGAGRARRRRLTGRQPDRQLLGERRLVRRRLRRPGHRRRSRCAPTARRRRWPAPGSSSRRRSSHRTRTVPTTLYDRVLQRMVDLGLVPAPTTTSYTDDIYPILQRARDMRWVEGIFGAHTWPDPVTAQPLVDAIFARLRPSGDMPALNGGDSVLTPTQLAHMQRWQAGTYAADWAGVPPAGDRRDPRRSGPRGPRGVRGRRLLPRHRGRRPERRGPPDPARPRTRRRSGWRPSVTAGTISQAMALPWQADFKACGDNWWPVPRPNDVIAQDTGSPGPVGPRRHQHGRHGRRCGTPSASSSGRGPSTSRCEHCDEASITLLTPNLRFVDVPQGPMGMVREAALAITFEVLSPGSAVTLEYAPGGGPADPQLIAATHLGDRRPDRAQRRRDGPALGHLPDRRRAVVDPDPDAHRSGGRLGADLAGHGRRQHGRRGRPRRRRWCWTAPAA